MKISEIVLLTLLTIGLGSSGPALGQSKTMYSWTDENGVVHFSDTKPTGQEAQAQAIPSGSQASGVGGYGDSADASAAAQQRREEIAQKHDQAKVDQAIKSAQCTSWQSEVDRLEPHRRVFFTNEKGEVERMDDVERTNRVAELKQQIAANCN